MTVSEETLGTAFKKGFMIGCTFDQGSTPSQGLLAP